MRTSNIKVEFAIPIDPNKPDLNGNIYTEEAILNSLESYKNTPIIIRESNDAILPVGVINEAYVFWSEQPYVVCKGNIMFGGTDCDVIKSYTDENGVIVIDEFNITGVGISG